MEESLIGGRAVILFDGHCHLCSWSVQFILRRDPKGYFSFMALQHERVQQILADHQWPALDTDSVVLIEQGKLYTQSTAALRITRHLRRGWPLFQVGYILPRFLRDTIYKWIARNRFKWFGRRTTCWLPSSTWRGRFL